MQITDNILAISCNAVDVKDLMSAEQRSNEEINRTLKSTGFYKLSSFRGLKINEVFRKIKVKSIFRYNANIIIFVNDIYSTDIINL